MRTLHFTGFALALVAAAACGGGDKAAASDSALAKDLALANQQSSQPTFQDTAVAPAPKPAAVAKQNPPAPTRTQVAQKPQPKVEAPAPAPVTQAPPPVAEAPVQAPAPVQVAPAAAPVPPGSLGAGTGLALTSGSKVCTTTNMAGDKLVATVNSPVTGANGAVIPAGSNVVLEVAAVQSGQDEQSARILLKVRSVIVNDKTYNVDGDVALQSPLEKTKVADGDPNADKKKVIGGAIVGGILGQMIGHNTKGTVIGAAAGAAAGAGMAKAGEKWQACLPAGAALRLILNSTLVL